jgi:hypothetical protein
MAESVKVHICPYGTLWDLRDFKLIGASIGVTLAANMGSADDKKRYKVMRKEVDRIVTMLEKRQAETKRG